MITAIVLINTERTRVNSVGAQLAGIDGVDEVYSVSGRYDLLAILRLPRIEELSVLITEKLSKVEGITHTESMIAFKKISAQDIAGMFDLGS
ncbi:MAG TPA: Lrp/AsnC ligand binding domain-containing protein [Prolixibacteraceae bacterium]|nr:Lrp/AsnC ligand binding domain-containing protein [Prolixibacteraceae bacterium]